MKQYIVDAFTTRVFRGNPAAVVLLKDWLPEALMQAIAAENNLAETAFVVGSAGAYSLRWFTPVAEIDLCGHATLATAFVIGNFTNPELKSMTFHTRSGDLLAAIQGDEVTLDLPACVWQEIPVTLVMGAAIGVTPSRALLASELLLVVDTPEQVINLRPDMGALDKLPGMAVAVTARGEPPYDCVSRVFAPELAIPEDPVTGSSHCLIAPYWAQVLGKREILARQASPRGGELRCQVCGPRVRITGNAVLFAIADIYPRGFTLYGREEKVQVLLEPEGTKMDLPRPKTVARLLQALHLAEETALVARTGRLLTPDCHIYPDDELLVRKAGSRG